MREHEDPSHHRSDLPLKLPAVVGDVPVVAGALDVQHTAQAQLDGVQQRVEVALAIRGPALAHLPARGEERAAQSDQAVDPRFERAEEHLVSDVRAFAAHLSVGIDEAIDAADAADRRIGEVCDDRRHAVGREGRGDVGEDHDLARRRLERDLLCGLLASSLRSPGQADARRVGADDSRPSGRSSSPRRR